ncbi:MAG: diadenylate cyclase CdaA [Defluviitaleaceae bacterium]|nr:diadenylate cyclase CdaA [Defluviitaleaceae bacterium]
MNTNTFFIWELNPLSTISILDFIDIAIIAFIIYRLTRWLLTTKARSLLKGIIVILIVWGLSFVLGFTAIFWLVNSFFSIGVIAMIIVFQPELRRVLEELGRGKFAPHFLKGEEGLFVSATKEIVEASESLANESTGALIIIEAEVSLGELSRTGVELDAVISKQLLMNIFENNAPLHDGAVIIRKDRIVAASCILPLTETEIGRELGTRHRAAVGVSEAYDCLAIVVSEETSKISIARGGKLSKNINKENLQRVLLSGVKPGNSKKLILWKGDNK